MKCPVCQREHPGKETIILPDGTTLGIPCLAKVIAWAARKMKEEENPIAQALLAFRQERRQREDVLALARAIIETPEVIDPNLLREYQEKVDPGETK